MKDEILKIPEILLDDEGYPTDEYIAFIKGYTSKTMPIINFVLDILQDNWQYGEWGFKLGRVYKGVRKLELHTGGWSGNEEIIAAITSNIWLTAFKMKYVKWYTGGHYYFEIRIN